MDLLRYYIIMDLIRYNYHGFPQILHYHGSYKILLSWISLDIVILDLFRFPSYISTLYKDKNAFHLAERF